MFKIKVIDQKIEKVTMDIYSNPGCGGHRFWLELRTDEHDKPCKLEYRSYSFAGVPQTWSGKELNTCIDKIFNLEKGIQVKIINYSTRHGHHFCPEFVTVKFNHYSCKTVELHTTKWENLKK